MFGHQWLELAAAALVLTLGTARITRFITDDDMPIIEWFRQRWFDLTINTGWAKLPHCAWCVSPYISAANLAWAIIGDLQPAWWVFNAWLAVAWLASFITMRDIPQDQRG